MSDSQCQSISSLYKDDGCCGGGIGPIPYPLRFTCPRRISRLVMCEECGVYPADLPLPICPGCEAYTEHQS